MFKNSNRWHTSTKYIYSQFETLKHKFWVFYYVNKLCLLLYKRAILHDLSKLQEPEASAFANAVRLDNIEFGTPEYKASTEKLKPCLQHHYSCNSHHFQHYPNKFRDMTTIDRLEMVADWTASSRRTKNGDIYKSIDIQQSRAGFTNADKQWIKSLVDFMKGKL